MARREYTRIVIARPDGRAEVVTRTGFLDQNAAARAFSHIGVVTSVRHESLSAVAAARPRTHAIFPMGPPPATKT